MSKKNILIELNPERSFVFDIASALNDLMTDHTSYFHIYVKEDNITIEEEGYNTREVKRVVLDTKNLVDNFFKKQTRDAIVTTYQYAFAKNQELASRIDMIKSNPNADSHWGASHTFYHDRTGKYPEYMIVERIVFLNKINLMTENSQSNGFHK